MGNLINIQISPEFLESVIRDEVRAFLEKHELQTTTDIRGPTDEYTRKEFLKLINMSWNTALKLFWYNEDFKPLRYQKDNYARAPWFVCAEGLEWFKKWERENRRR
ncbi:hypothetical protein LISE100100_00220 [Listeria seeligeri]|uniref:hypothetical protein n=1 Tax=Listeria seeligeri TaxID=1640 RepID=UPI00059B0A86|nr:hypothetical protein [Listeria seeligeri]